MNGKQTAFMITDPQCEETVGYKRIGFLCLKVELVSSNIYQRKIEGIHNAIFRRYNLSRITVFCYWL